MRFNSHPNKFENNEIVINTSELWKELHLRCLNHSPGKNDIHWLHTVWIPKIPRYSSNGSQCKCREDWYKWYSQNPPNFSTPESYFDWSVRAHNSVNIKLNKPLLSLDEAKKLYSYAN